MKQTTNASPPFSHTAVERIIGWYDQTTNQTVHHIHESDILNFQSVKNRFKLEHVHDMSYRPFSNGDGLFYLHTNQGVFTYTIDADPTDFIRAYIQEVAWLKSVQIVSKL